MTTKVFFGTNRGLDRRSPPIFNTDPHEDGARFYRVGEVEVSRKGHPWPMDGEAYEPGEPKLGKEKRPSRTNPGGLPASPRLFDGMRETMAAEGCDAIVFLHGFASSFDSAMARAAEISEVYLAPAGEEGAAKAPLVFAFSWPSHDELFFDETRSWAYSGDRERAAEAGPAMARCALRLFEYLAALKHKDRCLQRIHLVAHSMGNWALRAAVQNIRELAARNAVAVPMIFDNVFLMAADIEADCLEHDQWLAPLFGLTRRVHVYHAQNDKALSASDLKPNQGNRLGHQGPRNMAALPDTVRAIDCRDVSWTPADGATRHQYYRLAPEVIHDVKAVLAETPEEAMLWRTAGPVPGRFRLKLDNEAREALRAL
ncbi:MAG: alpha/beta hydrolase [Pseudomonadota bacterium]